MKLKTLFIFSILICCLHSLLCASTDGDTLKLRKKEFIPLPILYFSPETRLAVGSLGILLFKAGGHARTSTIDFAALYSQKKQMIIAPMYSIFTSNEKFYIKGSIFFTKYPEYYYGVGDETSASQMTTVAYKTFQLYNRILRRVGSHAFVGIQQQYYNTFDVNFARKAEEKNVPGLTGSVSSGAGPSFLYDTRDNTFNPTKGVYAELSSIIYHRALGGQYAFGNHLLDIRTYKSVSPNTIFAFQAYANLNFGYIPFKQMCTVGGANVMRGYYNGRFRDKKLIALQAEWRQHVYGRLGCTVFADIGDVMSTLNAFEVNDLKPTAGCGLRYMISKKERLNARIDAGFGKNTHGIYFNIAEAF